MALHRIAPNYDVPVSSPKSCNIRNRRLKKKETQAPPEQPTDDVKNITGDEKSKSEAHMHPQDTLEYYFHKLETILHTHAVHLDHQLTAIAHELRSELVDGPMARAGLLVNYLEQTTIGHEIADLALAEKVARGVEYVEQVVEHSRFTQTIQTALTSACDRLLTYEELPHEWRENPYILGGYRFCGSLTECLFSVFKMHNETINIWTHIAGFMLFLFIGIFHMPYTHSWVNGTWLDRVPMVIFVAAALKCLFCSVFWHSCCSICHLDVKRKMACVDYTGITICICASILTTEYSVLKCHPLAQAFYMFITLTCGGFGLLMSWNPKFDTAGAKPMRALFFCCFAVFGGISGLHAMVYRGVAETWGYYSPVIKSIMCYFVGVLFYATLFPEKYITFKLNWGMSHNIWHCFVVAGIYYHYKAMLEMFSKAVNEVCMA